MRTRIGRKLLFTVGEAGYGLWRLHRPLQRLVCLAFGHEPDADQCGRPEHDACLWCQKSMPGAAPRRAALS